MHRHLFICRGCADRQSLLGSLWRGRCARGYQRAEPRQIKSFGENPAASTLFFPELPIQWPPKEDEEEGCRRNDRTSGKRRGDERITVGKENGRCDREDEGEERG